MESITQEIGASCVHPPTTHTSSRITTIRESMAIRPIVGRSILKANLDLDHEAHRTAARSAFQDVNVRKAFIWKFYAIITFQLLITIGVLAFVMNHRPTELWILDNFYVFFIAVGIAIVVGCAIGINMRLRRTGMINYVLLIIFTVIESYMVALIGYAFSFEDIPTLLGITTLNVIALILLAIQTTIEFTYWRAFFLTCLLALVIVAEVRHFLTSHKRSLLVGILAILYSGYLIYDTQRIVLVKDRKIAIGPDEYIFASLFIWITWILFLFFYKIIVPQV